MIQPPPTLIDSFEVAAKTAQAAENNYRAEAAREIARLEHARITCFRRVRLVKLLTGPSAEAETVEAAVAAQRCAVADEFGWDAEREDHRIVLARLEHPGRAIWMSFHSPAGDATHSLETELTAFEHWYQGHAGQPFYTLFDQYVPQAPRVDF